METPSSFKDTDSSFPSSSRSSVGNKLIDIKRNTKAADNNNNNKDGMDELHRSLSRVSRNSSRMRHEQSRWYQIRWGSGMVNDFKRRAPYYPSDWTDAWDYRVVPATVYMFFANILPALAFSLTMFDRTGGSYGVNEVLLSSVLGAVVFSLFSAQPLTIVGVTGPITVFCYTIYQILPPNTNYLGFMCLIGLWSMGMHWVLAITNSCNALRYVTRCSCDTFGVVVCVIYIQQGVEVLIRQFSLSKTSGYLSITVALLMFIFSFACGIVGESTMFHRWVRKFIEDYGTPLCIVFFTGFAYIYPMETVNIKVLPTSESFFPTADRGWLVNFWDIRDLSIIGSSFGFALLLTALFYFDHNVSSLIAQGSEFPLKKPAGFHWDIFLLGLTTGVAGILGLPFPNGLIPQAPFHTASLCVTEQVVDTENPSQTKRVNTRVVENRVSNLAQGLLTLGTMSGPLLVVLHLIPQGVLSGLFFVMGIQGLVGNGLTQSLLYLCRDRTLSQSDPLRKLHRQWVIWVFVSLQIAAFAVAFAMTQTVAAIAFPLVIIGLIPIRAFALPLWFTEEELNLLDAPTASAFTMESVGGQHGDHENVTPLSSDNEEAPKTEEKDFAVDSSRIGDQIDAAEKGEGGANFTTVGDGTQQRR